MIISHSPAGTSVQNMVHFGQEVRDGRSKAGFYDLHYNYNLRFQIGTYGRYDFGSIGNSNNYGQRTPPPYDATKVLAPVMTFWGDNDWLADPLV